MWTKGCLATKNNIVETCPDVNRLVVRTSETIFLKDIFIVAYNTKEKVIEHKCAVEQISNK